MSDDWAQWLVHLTAEEREKLASAIEAHARRQLATVAACGAALTFAPTLDERFAAAHRAKEELEHFELAAGAYAELGRGDLMEQARSAPPATPISWEDAAMAQFCLCLAAAVDLEPFRDRAGAMGEAVRRVLSHEREHVRAAVAMLREADVTAHADKLAALFSRWRPAALASLCGSDTPAAFDARARELLPTLA